jgi:hypothetical protein
MPHIRPDGTACAAYVNSAVRVWCVDIKGAAVACAPWRTFHASAYTCHIRSLGCRTVADGTCSFPTNFFGCETAAAKYTGGVKYIAEDYELECQVGRVLGGFRV